ncbi:MAG TPA: response regulator [Terriglobales bacterium]|nr:response regulator [Terriglobales bacterium]
MAQQVRVLFVDDEPAIRMSLPAILRMHGFEVISAGDVGEAVQAIASRPFDVLISDLNIGSPGDGFTVVSAMRRTQPNCVTLILTGYPAFETALQAIRSQVDDYLIKPAGVQELVAAIEDKLRNRRPHQLEQLKRLPQILHENVVTVANQILHSELHVLQLARIHPTPEESREAAEQFVRALALQIESSREELMPEMLELARRHGQTRFHQGYSAPMLVEEVRLIGAAVLICVHQNLLAADLSQLLPEMKLLSNALLAMLREAINAHESVVRAA